MTVKIRVELDKKISDLNEKPNFCPYGNIFIEINGKPFDVSEKTGQVFGISYGYVFSDLGVLGYNIPDILSKKVVELSVLEGETLEIINLGREVELSLYQVNGELSTRKKANKIEFVKAVIAACEELLKQLLQINDQIEHYAEVKKFKKGLEKVKKVVKKFEEKNK